MLADNSPLLVYCFRVESKWRDVGVGLGSDTNGIVVKCNPHPRLHAVVVSVISAIDDAQMTLLS